MQLKVQVNLIKFHLSVQEGRNIVITHLSIKDQLQYGTKYLGNDQVKFVGLVA